MEETIAAFMLCGKGWNVWKAGLSCLAFQLENRIPRNHAAISLLTTPMIHKTSKGMVTSIFLYIFGNSCKCASTSSKYPVLLQLHHLPSFLRARNLKPKKLSNYIPHYTSQIKTSKGMVTNILLYISTSNYKCIQDFSKHRVLIHFFNVLT